MVSHKTILECFPGDLSQIGERAFDDAANDALKAGLPILYKTTGKAVSRVRDTKIAFARAVTLKAHQ